MKIKLIPGEELRCGDTVVHKANPAGGVYVITHRCTGFWGKPSGKMHISGFAEIHDGGAVREERNVYDAEMVKVEVT